MKPRRRRGATLGLVAACVLVIIVIGVGAFFLAKILGGGREVANATDAGTLNVAKQALRGPATAYTMTNAEKDFWPLEDSKAFGAGSKKITLFVYNRCVGQALLVALNADQENTPQARSNAQAVFGQLKTIGQFLKNKLTTQGTLQPDFDSVAGSNNTRMFNPAPVAENSYDFKWMKDKGSTNIYFDPSTLQSLNASAIKFNTGADKVPPAGAYQSSYVSGYDAMNIPGAGISGSIVGVPVFPQQKPHLVNLADFTGSAWVDPNGFAPPNAFKIQTQSTEQKSGSFGGAVACAIVGAVKSTGGGAEDPDFQGAIPGGYIEIANLPSMNVGGYQNADPNAANDSIFNNELYQTPLELSDQGGGPVAFSTQAGALQAWADYNASESPPGPAPTAPDTLDANNRWTSKEPTGAQGYPNNSPPVIYIATSSSTGTAATGSDLLAIKNGSRINCTQDLINTNLSDAGCSGYLQAFENAYGRNLGTSPPPSGVNWSAVDGMKLELLTKFQQGQKNVQIKGTVDNNSGPATNLNGQSATGLGKWKQPVPFYAKWPNAALTPLETTGSVWDLLSEVGSCASSQLLGDMLQRVNEIKPGTSMAQLKGILQAAQCPMGASGTLYIHLAVPADPTSALVCDQNVPSTYTSGLTPDGPNSSTGPSEFCDTPQYNLYNGAWGMIDSKYDDDLHDRPYRTVSPNNLTGQDHAFFQSSSGFGNLLGKLEFSNTTQGEDDFSRPN